MPILSTVLLTFGSVGAAFFVSTPRAHYASWMRNEFVAVVTNVGGFLCGFYAIYVAISGIGLIYGLITWVLTGIVSAAIIGSNRGWYPGFLMLSLIAMVVGVITSFV